MIHKYRTGQVIAAEPAKTLRYGITGCVQASSTTLTSRRKGKGITRARDVNGGSEPPPAGKLSRLGLLCLGGRGRQLGGKGGGLVVEKIHIGLKRRVEPEGGSVSGWGVGTVKQ